MPDAPAPLRIILLVGGMRAEVGQICYSNRLPYIAPTPATGFETLLIRSALHFVGHVGGWQSGSTYWLSCRNVCVGRVRGLDRNCVNKLLSYVLLHATANPPNPQSLKPAKALKLRFSAFFSTPASASPPDVEPAICLGVLWPLPQRVQVPNNSGLGSKV